MLKNFSLRNFSRYLLVGLSAMVLLFTAQQAQPFTVFAEKCQDKVTGAVIPCPAAPRAQPAPPAPAAPASPITCYRCVNTNAYCESYSVNAASCSTNCDSCPNKTTVVTPPSGGSGSCVPGGAANFSWSPGSKTGVNVINYTLRINKAPGEQWTPNSGSGDIAVEVGNATSRSVQLTPGDYPDWTVQAGFSDGSTSDQAHFGAFVCPAVITPPACVPDNATCNAPAPACGTTTTGKNNCNLDCTKTGVACTPACVPTPNVCSATAPACGTTTTGVDTCDRACTKVGLACEIARQGCPNGTEQTVVNSQIVCVQTIVINTNTNTITNNNSATAVATGGTVYITNPAPAPQVILASTGNVGVGTSYIAGVTTLPKTGLPIFAWSALAFIPAGLRMRRFSKVKKDLENHPSYIFEDRKFRAES